ncbi:MAG: hypothetical protein Q9227_001306 [Pyrenula ochraceoflavens]
MFSHQSSMDTRLLQAITSIHPEDESTIPFPIMDGKSPIDTLYDHPETWRERSFSECSGMSSDSTASYFSDISETDTELTEPVSTLTSPTSTYLPSKPALKIVLGTASMGDARASQAKFHTPQEASALLDTFSSRGYSDLDTARAYPVGRGGTCEKLLGRCDSIHTWSNISSKVDSCLPGAHRAKNIRRSIEQSLKSLNAPYGVDIMYLHAPDRATSFLETLNAMNQAYNEGHFQRFGLSNYSAEEVEEVVRICEENNFVRPSVYQGQYNALCRSAELNLLDVLRRYSIAFYAYSPTAGGFFSGKVSRHSTSIKGSRWDKSSPLGRKYSQDYFHDELFQASLMVNVEAKQYGISGHAAALRWLVYHSALDAALGDACCIGASSVQQLEENLDILEQGPLPSSLVKVLDMVWNKATKAGPKYHF